MTDSVEKIIAEIRELIELFNCGFYDESDGRLEHIADRLEAMTKDPVLLEAGCAEMRSVIDVGSDVWQLLTDICNGRNVTSGRATQALRQISHALSTDAGRELLERLRKAEGRIPADVAMGKWCDMAEERDQLRAELEQCKKEASNER